MNLPLSLLYFPSKGPTDTLDYTIDFTPFLAGDTIANASVTAAPSGLTVGTVSYSSTMVTCWLGGGTAGTEYTVSCAITTTGNRSATRSAILYVQNH